MTAPAPPIPANDPHTKVGNALTVTQPGERTVCEIKRHPIGIMGVYIGVGLLLVIVAVLAFVVAPHFHDANGSGSTATKIGALIFLVFTALGVIYTLIASKVYWGNSWIVTTDSVTQMEQDSLFKRQSSQLSLGSLEDVTAEQNGILPHMFNYGWLRVETAGERSKFVFQFCPNPNYYAQQVLAARENYVQNRRGAEPDRHASLAEASPQLQPPQPQAVPDQPAPGQAGDPGYDAFMPQPPAAATSPQPQTENPPDDNNSFIVPGV